MDELSPQMRFAKAALPVIKDRLEDVLANEAGTREGADEEPLHDMRVASRRLRAALEAFRECFPRPAYRPVRAMAAQLTRDLGTVRDLDVLLAELRRQAGRATHEEQPGVRSLILAMETERAQARLPMLATLDDLQQHDFRHRVLSLARKAHGPGHSLSAEGRKQCLARLADLYDFAPYVHDEARSEELHEMRKAAKHLRYGMEIFRVCLGPTVKERIADVKEIQDSIGQIHDCDVLMTTAHDHGVALATGRFEELAAVATSRRGDQERLSTLQAALAPPETSDPLLGLLALLGRKMEERHARYTTFIRWWDEQGGAGLQGKLYACLTEEAEQEESK